jgi:hypothetical protein
VRPAKRPVAGQDALFVVHTCEIGVPDAEHPLRTDSAHCGGCPPGPRRGASLVTARAVIEWPNGIRPWDPIDEADRQLGWEHTPEGKWWCCQQGVCFHLGDDDGNG